jgi:hypothetical protein
MGTTGQRPHPADQGLGIIVDDCTFQFLGSAERQFLNRLNHPGCEH